jgi:hypothetical protein
MAVKGFPGTVSDMTEKHGSRAGANERPRLVLDLEDFTHLADEDLRRALLVLHAEENRRALERAEPAALVEDGFSRGFLTNGMGKDPWLSAGILVCPGAKIDRSAMSHRCGFVRIDSSWVWEHPDLLEDVVRHLPGPHSRMQSVSLVPVGEQCAVDLIEARTRNGVHELVGIRSFTVSGGELLLVSQRSVGKVSHR